MHSYLDFNGFLAFAHRGGAEEAPENTMAAFQAAVDLGYRYLETDAYTTADGVLLSFHDTVLDRVTDAQGVVAEVSWDEVRKAKVAGTEPIPLMAEVLDAWPDVRVNIDPKVDSAVEPLIKLLKDLNVLDRVCIGSFSAERIQAFRDEFGDKVCTSMGPGETARLRGAAFHLPTGAIGANCAQIPVRQYGLTLVDRRMVSTANRLGLQIHVWTIDERAEMERLIDLGVHGLMTDRPSLLKEVLQERGIWRT
jgi:glycerophosphoryl diester phosphodiesterase